MKNKTKLLAIAALLMGASFTSSAQSSIGATSSSATATAFAQIVSPISLNKTGDLIFGSIVKNPVGGTVELAPDGTVTPTGVTMFTGPGAMGTAAAEFEVAGDEGYSYNVTLPLDGDVVLFDGLGNSMPLTAFTHNASGVFGNWIEVFKVGATLNVGPNQTTGYYTSPDFTVTVAYN
jgi:hypothetical protein